MSLLQEKADTCFKRLLQESRSQKFHKSLERVRKACDNIESMKGLLNYSRVAKYTENHFGSPKRQSIMNNADLRLYIDLRKQENKNYKRSASNTCSSKNKVPEYPCDNLDLKTKSYIDQLRARNAFLEKSMQQLQQEILNETRKNPIDLEKSIVTGAQDDLSMKISQHFQNEIDFDEIVKLLKAMSRLLEVTKDPAFPLDLKSREEKEYLTIESPMGIEKTILYGDELQMLKRYRHTWDGY